MQKNITAIILAGGKGTRLGEVTKITPKPLIKIGENPFIFYVINNLSRYGITKFIISTGYKHEAFEEFIFYEKSLRKFSITLVKETFPMGTGGGLKMCEQYINEDFLLLNGDTFYDINILDLFQYYKSQENITGCIALKEIKGSNRYGNVVLKNERVMSFREKEDTIPNNNILINGGIAIFSPEIFGYLSGKPQSLERETLPELAQRGLLGGKIYKNYFIDIGLPLSLKKAKNEIPQVYNRGAIFLDRDGVINKDFGYVGTLERFEWIEGAIDAIKTANNAGYLVIVITNQSGIGRGLYTEEDFHYLMEAINNMLKEKGAHIDDYYYCPHHEQANLEKYKKRCSNRKPGSGMLLQAINDWNINLERSIFIGDQLTDVESGKNIGVDTHLFNSKIETLDQIVQKFISATNMVE